MRDVAICRWSLAHRDKHRCGCICALDQGHTGRHECDVQLSTHQLRDILAEAMQDAWNEFTSDTGCYPDCLKTDIGPGGRKRITADFEMGNFAEMVTGQLVRAIASRSDGMSVVGREVVAWLDARSRAEWREGLDALKSPDDVIVMHPDGTVTTHSSRGA